MANVPLYIDGRLAVRRIWSTRDSKLVQFEDVSSPSVMHQNDIRTARLRVILAIVRPVSSDMQGAVDETP
jgi:hypothetical protein